MRALVLKLAWHLEELRFFSIKKVLCFLSSKKCVLMQSLRLNLLLPSLLTRFNQKKCFNEKTRCTTQYKCCQVRADTDIYGQSISKTLVWNMRLSQGVISLFYRFLPAFTKDTLQVLIIQSAPQNVSPQHKKTVSRQKIFI